jgi:hypothetical protein
MRHSWLLVVLPIFASAPLAQSDTAFQGYTIEFGQADGGAVTCRRLESADCVPVIRTGTADPSSNYVQAQSEGILTGLGIPNYAKASIWNDFTVEGAGEAVLDAQISVTYDYFSSINVAGLSKIGAELSLELLDVTYNSGTGSGVSVATHTLLDKERTTDQGVTDITQGAENNYLTGVSSSFVVKLTTGHRYRLAFQLETLGEVMLAGVARVVTQAARTRLAVTLEEDERQALLEHDARLTAHDQHLAHYARKIERAIAEHDADVRALLRDLQKGQKEIIHLLGRHDRK